MTLFLLLVLCGAGCSQVAPAQASVSEKAPVASLADSSHQSASARRSTRWRQRPARRNRRPQGNPYGFNRVLKYDSIDVDFGEVSGKDLVFRVVPFHNPQPESVTVKGVTTTCPCAVAVITTPEIPSKGKGQLEIMVDPTKTAREFGAFVSIQYEDREDIDRVKISGRTVKPK